MDPIAVGLVGAGPWASMFHAPVLAAGPETRLAGIWARRAEAAEELAGRYGVPAFASYEELLDSCQVMAFAVPPAVQAEMAIPAARAGKTLLLDKPIADSLDSARRLADEIGAAGVGSLVLLTARYAPSVRTLLHDLQSQTLIGAEYENVNGAFLAGPFSQSPWRHERGILLDVGPHALDLLTSVLGRPVDVAAANENGWVRLLLRHEGGATSTASLCATYSGASSQGLTIISPTDRIEFGLAAEDLAGTPSVLRRDLADVVRSGAHHPCDAQRGLELQTFIAAAEEAIASRSVMPIQLR